MLEILHTKCSETQLLFLLHYWELTNFVLEIYDRRYSYEAKHVK